MTFAVLDLETTGVYSGGHDRVLEVGVVRLSPGLTPEREYTTLVNPGRDVGPTWLHGISAGDVLDAPQFSEIAGALAELLDGKVIVGHNVGFDLRFLESEFGRAGHPITRLPYLDTMQIGLRMGAASRRLEEMCDLFGIPLARAHSALEDARATAALFARCVDHFGPDRMGEWVVRPPFSPSISWPSSRPARPPFPREQAAARKKQAASYLASLIRELPVSETDPADWQGYYSVLDRALEDRRITIEEGEALRSVAMEYGLSRQDLVAAHLSYLRSLIAVALHDGVISELERKDLQEVAAVLDLSSELPSLLSDAIDGHVQSGLSDSPLLRGRTVCFTGALNAIIDGERVSRERACELAMENGMLVAKGVTKKLDYLVVADPDSLSGKARKAREYGTRILAEAVFWNMLGVGTGA